MQWTAEDRKVRIFCSADVVGSTAYKTKQAKDDPAQWPRFYSKFFEDFHAKVTGAVDEIKSTQFPPSHDLGFWKLLGDEILYSAIIGSAHDAFVLTKAFHRAVFSYDKDVGQQDGLRIKGTAWIAGFPIRNSEIKPRNLSLNADKPNELLSPLDYIGLDIDIGFRLGHTSRAGRMTVSMDLADLLAQNTDSNLRIFHLGWERFKGVFDNAPYPIFWVAEPDKLPKMPPWQEFDCPFTRSFVRDKKSGETEDSASKIRELIRQTRDSLPDLQLFPPYFKEDDMPPIHKKIWEQERQKQSGEEATDVLQGESPFGEEELDD